MKLWLISQTANLGWDTYDSAVVAAKTEADAREIHPSEIGKYRWIQNKAGNGFAWGYTQPNGEIYYPMGGDWTVPANVKVQLIGTAVKGTEVGVICSSFNAG